MQIQATMAGLLTGVAMTATASSAQSMQTDDHGRTAAAVPINAEARPTGASSALGVPAWEALGPFGGDIDDVAVSPSDSDIVLAGLAPGGGTGGTLYRSTDGAQTWSEVSGLSNTSVFDIEFAPDGTAYIGTQDSVWTSTDDGATWSQQDLGVGANDTVMNVTIDPNDANTIWIGIADALGNQDVNIMRSTDGGTSWTDRTPNLPEPISGQGIAIDPNDSDKVFAVFGSSFAGGSVWRSTNGGSTWTDVTNTLPVNPMMDVITDGQRVIVGGGLLFGSQFVGVYESTDDGNSWTALHDGSWPLLVVNDLAFDPNNSDIIYAATDGQGVNRTFNGGDTWEISAGNTADTALNSVDFAPGSSDVIYLGASSKGVFKSTDSGDNFEPSSAGIGALNVVSVDANPNNADELAIAFQGLNDGGLFTSTDGGETWTGEPVPATRWNTVRFAPDGTLYAISDGPTTVAQEGVYVRNGDGSWDALGPDQGDAYEAELFALWFSQNDPDLILVGGKDFGVEGHEATIWRSTDAGATWSKVYEGTEDFEQVVAIEFVEDGTDSVGLASFTDTGSPQEGGVLRTTNGGTVWSLSNTGLPTSVQGSDLAASPTDTQTFYLANNDISSGDVHVTNDAGQTWSNLNFGRVFDVVVNPNDDQVLYVTQFNDPKVLRSTDQGDSFEPFDDGLEFAGNTNDLTFVDGPTPRLLFASGTGTFGRDLEVACPQDIDGNSVVGVSDLLDLLGAWGTDDSDADIDGDGEVGVNDLLNLLGAWGPCS